MVSRLSRPTAAPAGVHNSGVKKLGLTEASRGAHLDRFQAVISPEQELIRKFRNVLNRLADA
jgi:hypothetical protein